MKTKTGRLLMSQIKGKSNQAIPVQTQNHTLYNTEHITPVKPKSLQQVLQENDKQNEGPEETLSQKNSYQSEITQLKQDNIKLSKQIYRLKNELQVHQLQPQSFSKQTQTIQSKDYQPHCEPKLENKDSKNYDFKNLSKLKQKCSALEVQNYRLIQNNYLLLLNLRKNLKFFRDSLGSIVSKIEGLEFSQAVKEVYNILNGLKHSEIDSEEFQRRLFPNRKEQQQLEEPKTPEAKKPQKNTKLSINSSLFNIKHVIQQTMEQRDNNIQVKIKTLHEIQPKPTPYSSRQSSSFHLLNFRNPDPDFFNHFNNKLFNSEIHDQDYQISALDQVSLQDKFETDWDNQAKKHPNVYKIHGNTTELYKMLMLQAMTIEGFFS